MKSDEERKEAGEKLFVGSTYVKALYPSLLHENNEQDYFCCQKVLFVLKSYFSAGGILSWGEIAVFQMIAKDFMFDQIIIFVGKFFAI